MSMDVVEPTVFWQLRYTVPPDPALLQLIQQLRVGAAGGHLQEERQPHRGATRVGVNGGAAKVEKDFIALMNKLSVQNHEAIEAQLWRFFQPLLFTFYTNHLWSLMYRQAGFNALYVDVLRQIHDRLGEDDQMKLKGVMRSHCDAFFRGFNVSLDLMVLPAGEDYDEFCDAVRIKKQSIGKLAALAVSLRVGMLEATSAEVLSRLAAVAPVAGTPEKVSVWTDHAQAVLAELPWSNADAHPILTTATNMASAPLPPKARFRITDLIEKLSPRGAVPTAPKGAPPRLTSHAANAANAANHPTRLRSESGRAPPHGAQSFDRATFGGNGKMVAASGRANGTSGPSGPSGPSVPPGSLGPSGPSGPSGSLRQTESARNPGGDWREAKRRGRGGGRTGGK